jgi:hypothetical protein
MTQSRIYQVLFALLVLAFVLYGWAFIQRTAITVDGQPMHALFDDAMISMQYAKNLAHGDGLVWNPGEQPVEGYSNPLWVLLMAVIHLFPIPLTETSLYVKLLSLLILAVNVVMVKLIADELTENPLVSLVAAGLTAFYYPLNSWSLLGMEVGLEALMLTGAILLLVRAAKRKTFTYWPYVILGLAVILRMDAVAPAVAIAGAVALFDTKQRKAHLAWGLGAVAAALALLTIFRLAYYGEWLPNTYYLKLGGVSGLLRISVGLRRFWDFVWGSNWILFAIPFMLPTLDRRKLLWPLYAALLSQVAYSIYVGGDAWEHVGGANRFIAAVMPIFFILLAHTLGQLQALILGSIKKKERWLAPATTVFIALFAFFSLFSFNSLNVQSAVDKWTLREKPVFTESIERYAQMGIALNKVTTSNATIAVVTAGNLPYFSERTSIDLLGKNDPVIAKGPARINSSLFEPGDYRPGHNKWDYAYSIGVLQPDVVAQTWENTDDEVAPYLTNYDLYVIDGIPYYFLDDSPNILWDKLPPQE